MSTTLKTLGLTLLVVIFLYIATPLSPASLIAAGIIAGFIIYKTQSN